ncbi:MAG: cupin domain-containing protein [Hyphomicrobiales bacterium]|jgi:mannose-6-phosphate isomerase-like protein (cupin superfamily)
MTGQVVAKAPADLKAYKISPDDTNYFACLADPVAEGVPFTFIVEIYEKGGATPPNTHSIAHEFFFILEGTGKGMCDGVEVDLAPGSSLLIPPGKEHIVKNTGAGKLYALCAMVPNEEFAELIHSGQEVALTDEDLAVISRRMPVAA